MSRGNYYYARGWVGNSESRWTLGEISRFEGYGDELMQSILLLVFGAIIQAFSAFADTSWLASSVPLFSLVLGVISILGILAVSEKGALYVGGWTFTSGLLFWFNLISAGEFLTDLIPVILLIIIFLAGEGFFDVILEVLTGGSGRDGSYF